MPILKPPRGSILKDNHLNRNIAGAWIFNENHGDLINDLGPDNLHLTSNGNTSWIGNNLRFNGSNSVLSRTGASRLPGSATQLTFIVGLTRLGAQPDSGFGTIYLENTGGGGVQPPLAVFLKDTGARVRINVSGNDASANYWEISNNFTIGEPHQLAISWYASTSTPPKMYFDGISQSLSHSGGGVNGTLTNSGNTLSFGLSAFDLYADIEYCFLWKNTTFTDDVMFSLYNDPYQLILDESKLTNTHYLTWIDDQTWSDVSPKSSTQQTFPNVIKKKILKPQRGFSLDRSHPMAQNLIGMWVPDQASRIGHDYSGNNNTGVLSSGTDVIQSSYNLEGDIFLFDGVGSSDNVLIGTGLNSFMTDTDFTIITRFLRTNIAIDGSLLNNYGGASRVNNEILFWVDDSVGFTGHSDRVSCAVVNTGTSTEWIWSESLTPLNTANEYNTIATVYTRGVGIRIYLNGIDDTDGTQNQTTIFSGTPAENWRIGTEGGDTGTREFQGGISYTMIWNRALSAQEVNSLYHDPFQMVNRPNPHVSNTTYLTWIDDQTWSDVSPKSSTQQTGYGIGKYKPPIGSRLSLEKYPAYSGSNIIIGNENFGLVGCWLFNEGQGDKVYDISRSELHGDLLNNPTWTIGPDGPCLDFDRTNRVKVPYSASGRMTQADFTISFYAKSDITDYTTTNGYVIGRYDPASSKRVWAVRINQSTDKWSVITSSNGTSVTAVDSALSADTSWHHFAFAVVSDSWDMYVDGVFYETLTLSGLFSTDTFLTIGGLDDTTNGFDGKISHAMYFEYPLTAAQINALYNNPYAFIDKPKVSNTEYLTWIDDQTWSDVSPKSSTQQTGYKKLQSTKPPRGSTIDWENSLTNNLTGYFLFNEGAGHRHWNMTTGEGYSHTGNTQSGYWSTNSPYGQAITLSGFNDVITMGQPSFSEFPNDTMSMMFIIKRHNSVALTQYDVICARCASNGANGWRLWTRDTSSHKYYFETHNGTVIDQVISTSPISTTINVFDHVVVTADGTNTRIYVNGIEEDSDAQVSNGVSNGIANNMYIGNMEGQTRNFPGHIVCCSFWNRALSAQEVNSLYHDPYQMVNRSIFEDYYFLNELAGGTPANIAEFMDYYRRMRI